MVKIIPSNIFIVIDIRRSFTQIPTLNILQWKKSPFSSLKPIVNTFITAITFFTNGKINSNFFQVLIRMPNMNDKDFGKISTLVQNFPKQARVLLRLRSKLSPYHHTPDLASSRPPRNPGNSRTIIRPIGC